jgi:hypothetical protein
MASLFDAASHHSLFIEIDRSTEDNPVSNERRFTSWHIKSRSMRNMGIAAAMVGCDHQRATLDNMLARRKMMQKGYSSLPRSISIRYPLFSQSGVKARD